MNLFVWRFANAQQVKPLLYNSDSSLQQKPSFNFRSAMMKDSGMIYPSLSTSLSPSYYTNTLGFFCTKELQIEKVVKFPLKFRLGSVDYTDKMEGKGVHRY